MIQEFYRVQIKKEAIKFSSAHMTVFPDGTKEPLHGHNYQVTLYVELLDASLKNMVSFAEFKKALNSICERWDEKLLIAAKCPFYEVIKEDAVELEFKLCGKRYVIPKDEIEFLQIENITTELLAQNYCDQFISKLEHAIIPKIKSISIQIDESGGQGASFTWTNPKAS
jgi:6-pyruvoyltetrahydropterin/6-carboxytetrahydropterin synthase